LRIGRPPNEVLCEAVASYRCGFAEISCKLNFSQAFFGAVPHPRCWVAIVASAGEPPSYDAIAPHSSRPWCSLKKSLESLGFGAVLARKEESPSQPLLDLLVATAKDAGGPLKSFSRETPFAAQTVEPIEAGPRSKAAPPGMTAVPAADYDFVVNGIEVENGNNPGVDVQFPWESSPRRNHHRLLHIPRFFIDRTPVTNAEFKQFVDSDHYHPADEHNFLRDWSNGTFPDGWGNKPVTWVSIEDARAYARWAGKRLPHVWEWQYAAQGTDGRTYPWGPVWDPHAVPPVDRSRTRRAPTDVDAFPSGTSPFGVLDMEGNVAPVDRRLHRCPHPRGSASRW
jgi:iron(II)-dependent oxidoreductase